MDNDTCAQLASGSVSAMATDQRMIEIFIRAFKRFGAQRQHQRHHQNRAVVSCPADGACSDEVTF